ncbi:PEP/pyruvate-binding domain-containing protein [Bacteroidota bacterium]
MTTNKKEIPRFSEKFFDSDEPITSLGAGEYGGKANGLISISEILKSKFNANDFSEIIVNVPTMTVIPTGVFDEFMKKNDLYKIIDAGLPDDRIALSFQKAELPFGILGDLRTLISKVKSPLAVRSSSMLEDALHEPFAGIYSTKMTPNNQPDIDTRFRKLIEAIKLVYASVYFKSARDYMAATNHKIEEEKMAVIIQEIVGNRNGDNFYPEVSGVARSYNFYPFGNAKPENGVVNLAFGLGKTIVDGGISWVYSPDLPKESPPYANVGELLKQTQTEFWSVNMGKAPAYDPINETEFMNQYNITEAEKDETLRYVVSTYLAESGRLSIGVGSPGPRVLNFGYLLVLNDIPLNNLIKNLLAICEEALDSPVEIEFAVTFNPTRFGFLQVRPMVVSDEEIEVTDDELKNDNLIIASKRVLGNGIVDSIKDIVFVNPDNFEAKYTPKIADELEIINKKLVSENKQYLLIGFGRWGSSDPWLGIPVNWGQVSGAKVILETAIEKLNVEFSQGSHFFHNLTSFNVSYFSVNMGDEIQPDWNWLNQQKADQEMRFVKHINLSSPLVIKVDGRSGRGVIFKPEIIKQ